MGVLERLRTLSADQRRALRIIDEQEQRAQEIAMVEEEHLLAHEVYLRRKDRLLGRPVPEKYEEIETARAELRRDEQERQRRFERVRMSVLAGHLGEFGEAQAQLALIPAE